MKIKSFPQKALDVWDRFKTGINIDHPEGNLAFNASWFLFCLAIFHFFFNVSLKEVFVSSIIPAMFVACAYYACCDLRACRCRCDVRQKEKEDRDELFNLNVAFVLFSNDKKDDSSPSKLAINFQNGFPDTGDAVWDGIKIIRKSGECLTIPLFTHSKASLERVEHAIYDWEVDNWNSLVEKENPLTALEKSRLLFDFLDMGNLDYIKPFMLPSKTRIKSDTIENTDELTTI